MLLNISQSSENLSYVSKFIINMKTIESTMTLVLQKERRLTILQFSFHFLFDSCLELYQ